MGLTHGSQRAFFVDYRVMGSVDQSMPMLRLTFSSVTVLCLREDLFAFCWPYKFSSVLLLFISWISAINSAVLIFLSCF